MGVRSLVDVVAPWPLRPSSSRALGVALLGPSLLLRARGLASFLSLRLLRAAAPRLPRYGKEVADAGGTRRHAGRGAGRGAGDRQGRGRVLRAAAPPVRVGTAGAGGPHRVDDDPVARRAGRLAGRPGRDPGRDGGDL